MIEQWLPDNFDPELNPNLDLTNASLRSNPLIYYRGDDGLLYCAHLQAFYKNGKKGSKKVRGRLVPGEFERLLKHYFLEEDNPGIDFAAISTKDIATHLNYRDVDGLLKPITPKAFLKNYRDNKGTFRPSFTHKKSGVGQNVFFMAYFDKDLNPEVNPDKENKFSLTKIRYRRKDGKIGTISIYGFMDILLRNDGVFVEPRVRERRTSVGLMRDLPAFMNWVDRDINSHINFETLKQTDQTTPIYYYDGEIRHHIAPISWVRNYEKNGVFVRTTMRYKEYAWDNPEFRRLYNSNSSLNPEIDPRKLRKTNKTKISIHVSDHVVKNYSVKSIIDNIKRHNGKFIPPIRIPEEKSLAVKFPESLLFWSPKNSVTPYEVSPNSGHQYEFICPRCGHHFSKALKNFAYSDPKCPQCRDEGKEGIEPMMPENIPFAIYAHVQGAQNDTIQDNDAAST